jgi:hypothetical protein
MSESELRPVARELVNAAREAQTPSAAQRERAYLALMAGLQGAAPASAAKVAAATPKAAGSAALGWLKWALPAAALVSAGVGAHFWIGQRHVSAQPTVQGVPPAPSATPVSPSPNAEPSALPPASAVGAASGSPPVRAPVSPKSSSGDLAEELTLLHQALAASRSGNAALALELARQHARQYPHSALQIERSAIEVRSLCVLGRVAEAHKIADRLHAQAPNSPVSAALEETCVGK